VSDYADVITQQGALIQYYLGFDPDTLSDDEFAKYWGRLIYAIKFDNKHE
jgi:hypothetical protein